MKKIIKVIWFTVAFFAGAGLVACLCAGDKELIVEYILPTVVALIFVAVIFNVFLIIMLKMGAFFGKKEYEKEKFSLEDKKYKEYYREILESNTPLILGLIDEYDISEKNIIAELLYLKMKNIIEFKDGKIVVLQKDNSDLNEIHKYIIECVMENGKLLYYKKGIIEETIKEAKAEKLLKEIPNNHSSNTKINRVEIKGILISLVIYFLIMYVLSLKNGDIWEVLDIFGVIVAFPVMFFYYSYVSKYTRLNCLIPYIRTKKGEELNQRLEGLKKYLTDYSLLDEQNVNVLELWDEYLIYSVMFGQNKKIVEEHIKYLEIREEFFHV